MKRQSQLVVTGCLLLTTIVIHTAAVAATDAAVAAPNAAISPTARIFQRHPTSPTSTRSDSNSNSLWRRILQGFGVGAVAETAPPTMAPTAMGTVPKDDDDWTELIYSVHYRLYTATTSDIDAAEQQVKDQWTETGLRPWLTQQRAPVSIERLVSVPLGKCEFAVVSPFPALVECNVVKTTVHALIDPTSQMAPDVVQSGAIAQFVDAFIPSYNANSNSVARLMWHDAIVVSTPLTVVLNGVDTVMQTAEVNFFTSRVRSVVEESLLVTSTLTNVAATVPTATTGSAQNATSAVPKLALDTVQLVAQSSSSGETATSTTATSDNSNSSSSTSISGSSNSTDADSSNVDNTTGSSTSTSSSAFGSGRNLRWSLHKSHTLRQLSFSDASGLVFNTVELVLTATCAHAAECTDQAWQSSVRTLAPTYSEPLLITLLMGNNVNELHYFDDIVNVTVTAPENVVPAVPTAPEAAPVNDRGVVAPPKKKRGIPQWFWIMILISVSLIGATLLYVCVRQSIRYYQDAEKDDYEADRRANGAIGGGDRDRGDSRPERRTSFNASSPPTFSQIKDFEREQYPQNNQNTVPSTPVQTTQNRFFSRNKDNQAQNRKSVQEMEDEDYDNQSYDEGEFSVGPGNFRQQEEEYDDDYNDDDYDDYQDDRRGGRSGGGGRYRDEDHRRGGGGGRNGDYRDDDHRRGGGGGGGGRGQEEDNRRGGGRGGNRRR